MNRVRIGFLVATVIGAAALTVLACSNEQTGVMPPPPSGLVPPLPGLTLQLRTPNPTDGAVYIEIRGPALKAEAVGAQGIKIYTEMVGDTLLRAIIVGPLEAGFLARVPLRDRQPASNYSVHIVEVADRGGVVRTTIDGYGVDIASQ